jgi:hypothetical protein
VRVRCIDHGPDSGLARGKIYEVTGGTGNSYFLDGFGLLSFPSWWFEAAARKPHESPECDCPGCKAWLSPHAPA